MTLGFLVCWGCLGNEVMAHSLELIVILVYGCLVLSLLSPESPQNVR